MRRIILPISTITTFILLPLLGLVFRNYHAPCLSYGEGDVTLNSLLFLLFAIYAIIVSTVHFVQCQNSWKTGTPLWKPHLCFTYLYIFIIAFSLHFLMIIKNINFTEGFTKIFVENSLFFILPVSFMLFFLVFAGLKFLNKISNFYLLISLSVLITVLLLPLITIYVNEGFKSRDSIMEGVIFSAAFLFPIGLILLYLVFAGLSHIKSEALPYFFIIILIPVLIVIIYIKCFLPIFILPSGITLLLLGIGGLKQLKAKPKIYLFINLLISLLFLLGGAPFALLIFVWWIKGGMNSWW